MIVPTAEMDELLSLLNGIGCFEDLATSWPRIRALVRKLDDIERRLKKKSIFRRPRLGRDERDGSPVLKEPEMRPAMPAEMYEFHAQIRSIIYRSAFQDPRADGMAIVLRKFAWRPHDDLQEGLR